MKLTTRGRYAITAMADLAAQGETAVVSLSEISTRQGISLSYLEQLFSKLRRNKLVASQRGTAGGYKLADLPGNISLDRIIAAVDEDIKMVGCTPELRQNCTGTNEQCLTHSLWDALEGHIEGFFAGITLSDVVNKSFRTLEVAE